MRNTDNISQLRESLVKDDTSSLTPTLVQLREQLLHTFTLLMSGEHTTRSVVEELQKEFDLGITTAYARVRDAKLLFGDVTTGHRMVDSLILMQRAERNWEDTALVQSAEDRVELRDKVLQTMIKLRGTGGDEGVVDPSKYEPHTYEIRLSKPVKRLLFGLLKHGVVDLDHDLPVETTAEVVEQEDPPA